MARRTLHFAVISFILFLCAVFPLRAEKLDLYTSGIRLVRDRYLYLETITSEAMLDGAINQLTDEVEWLMAETDGNRAVLRHGDGTLIGEVSVGGLDDLPDALAHLENLVATSGYPLDPELALDVEILRGAIGTLDHPSTVLYGERLESFDERLRGTLSGIGAKIGYEEGDILVRSVFQDGPAAEGGLRDGDIILRIDGISTTGMDVQDAVDRIRGPEGTTVEMLIQRGERKLTFTIGRAEIKIPNLEHRPLPSGVGYISISHFSEQTVDNLRVALAELASNGALAQGLVIDLRGNTGGSMVQAARSADQFLVEGRLVRTVGRDGAPVSNLIRQMNSDDEGTEPPVPVVILTDPRTASGSEILAGALKLLDRAVTVGQRTYGKGTVQKIFNLRPDVRMKLTVAEYLLVGDTAVAGVGLEPDVPTGAMIFDRNGLRVQQAVGQGLVDPVLFVQERPGWRADEELPTRDDPELELAERIVQQSRGPMREEILAAARKVSEQVRLEEDALAVSTFHLRDMDWSPNPAPPTPTPTAQPQVSITLETDGPPTAGEAAVVRALVENLGETTLYRTRVVIYSENRTWDGLVLPIGRLDAGQGAEGRRSVLLGARLPERLDEISLVVEADGLAPSTPNRQRLLIKSRPEPAIAVSGRLHPLADQKVRAELNIENTGQSDLMGVQVRFDFPADRAIELVDREGLLPNLAAGETRRVDLDLVVKEGFEAPTLPLTLKIKAERYGWLANWEFPIPTDQSTIRLEEPRLRWRGPVEVQAGDEVHLSYKATDDGTIDHVVIYVNGSKVAYHPGGSKRLDQELVFTAMAGSNRVVAYVEDDSALRTMATAWVYGRGSGDLSLSTDAGEPDENREHEDAGDKND